MSLKNETQEELNLSIIKILNNYYNKKNELINTKINQILEVLFNDLITILYPIYEVGAKRVPLLASYCKIVNNKLCVEKYKVSKELLDSLLIKFEATLEEYIGAKNEIEELIRRIPNLKDELDNGKWNHALITIDELEEVYHSPFNEEMKLLKSIYKEDEPYIIKKYLFQNNNRKHIDELDLESHFGSYTNDYSVNEKQWKVVNSVRNNQLISVTDLLGLEKLLY